jgi:ribosome maturation protein SDO1
MVKVEDAVIAKLKKNNQYFEILVDCESALKLRRGENVDIHDVLAVMNVFKDAHKGDIAADLEGNFGTDNIEEIAKEIIKKGELHLTMAYKKQLIDTKKKEIMNLIVRNAMDPVRKIPIPPQRIEIAMENAGIHIDPFIPAAQQMEAVVEKLRVAIPITFENRKFEILIPARHASACYGLLKKYGKITKESWLGTGSLMADVEMPAGMSIDFMDAINKKTGGDVQITEK